MDARARLDHALFQLTPTRTRCDLVLFHGGKSEKLASGLFQPFVSHLKSVQDEISRGGYSIALRPPTQNAHWFTKATFQRFVRFVSTPAVLERFVSIEREILQIESSVQLEEGVVSTNLSTRKSSDSLKKRGELGEADDAVENENSKVCLQRVLESRIALLRKQQAMAYARGLVAGFEIYIMDDLISFSDAFGASRLRDACINFKELYNKKHKDGLWMEELAAMAACPASDLQFTAASGITLANETDAINQNVLLNLPHASAPTSEKVQVPMSFPAHSPQYYYGSVGHTNQLPPYHGYPFPAMQPFPPHYPMNLQWPPNMDIQKSSSRRKKKSGNRKVESSDSSTSVSASDSDTQQDKKQSDVENSSKKKVRNKSNRKVVIQNINYITPKKKDGNKGGVSDESCSDEEAEVLELSHERIVEKSHGVLNGSSSDDLAVNALVPIDVEDEHFIVGSEGGNSLEARPTLGFGSERIPRKLTTAADPLAVLEKNRRNDDRVKLEGFENEENFCSLKERSAYADEGRLFSLRSEESGTHIGSAFSAGAVESTTTKSSRGEDWFVVNHSENTENQELPIKRTVFDGDHIFASERKGVLVDDSFFIQTQSAADDLYESSWKTDLCMDNDLSLAAAHKENDLEDILRNTSEPNDLSMIRERESNLESSTVSWGMDYAAEVSFPEANTRWSDVEKTDGADKKPDSNGVMNTDLKNIKVPGSKDRSKEPRSNVVRRHSTGSHISDVKTKRTPLTTRPIVRKTKFEMEEEIRLKMEALQLERQKRIAEKTAAGGLAPVALRRGSLESKAAKGSSIKSDNGKLQSTRSRHHL